MAYKPVGHVPQNNPRKLEIWLQDELTKIAANINDPNPEFITLQQLHAAPGRVYDGLTVYADGSDWDPGSGEGVYTYYNSGWNKLG